MRSLYPTLDHIGSDSSRSLFYFKVNLKQSSCLSDEELDKREFSIAFIDKNAIYGCGVITGLFQ